MSEPKCYVVMHGTDAAHAVCVIDDSPKELLSEFLMDNVGEDIRTVGLVEAKRLLGVYLDRQQEKRLANGVQLDLEDTIAQKAEGK
jgi:hypothetical protein